MDPIQTESVYRKNAAIAADWVEYCNAPNDGSNPRGGVDWAAERARNGHAAPYGVKYRELGNELQDLPVGWYRKAVRIFSEEMSRLCLIVQNLSGKDPLTAAIDMRGFEPAKEAETHTLRGEFPWSNNEPET